MCLSMPARVISINGNLAEVEFMGVKKQVGTTLLKDLKVGDYVLVHAGFAIEKISAEEAEKTLKIWEEIEAAGDIG
ncbi:MAG TPA: HypC/HybG/HupF family hydrogenase formation chaperone [Peptococcaceae bacterium]|nr:MAG: HypC hydrogenase expression/formation protein [Clostridia bacterium 41_269]HBT20356.1 HypC/HybG/HupF family hydrogenase formation chaperone [Peptococcaceae bacterium]